MKIRFILPHEIFHEKRNKEVANIRNLKLEPKTEMLLKRIIEAITNRLNILKDQISQEESLSKECKILLDFREDSLGIYYKGYSDILTEKMTQSIIPADLTLIIRNAGQN